VVFSQPKIYISWIYNSCCFSDCFQPDAEGMDFYRIAHSLAVWQSRGFVFFSEPICSAGRRGRLLRDFFTGR